jgi:hypothetical protein
MDQVIDCRYGRVSAMNKRIAYSLMLLGICLVVGISFALSQPPQIVGDEPASAPRAAEVSNATTGSSVDVSKIFGKIQIVTSFPDYKVQVVDSFPDLKVQVVNSFPDKPGKWQMVNSFPDFKIQLVDSFPDFKIKYVSSFPGKQ